jgi:hypothetical protein
MCLRWFLASGQVFMNELLMEVVIAICPFKCILVLRGKEYFSYIGFIISRKQTFRKDFGQNRTRWHQQ